MLDNTRKKTDDNIDPLEPLSSHRGWPIDFWSDYAPVRRASNFPLKLGVDVIQNPDNYTIEASLPGFQTFVQTGIVLQVDSNPVINIVLEVGQVTQTIEVTATTALVETRNLAVGRVR